MSPPENENGGFAGRRLENTMRPGQEHSAHCPGNSADAQQFVFASPTRLTEKSVWTLAVQCPFCGQTHKHGGGDGATPLFGHRAAHCGGGGYRLMGVQS